MFPGQTQAFILTDMNRRTVIKKAMLLGGLWGTTSMMPSALLKNTLSIQEPDASNSPKPLFRMDLCGGKVGIKADQEELIDLAQKHGFTSVEPLAWQLKALPAEKLKELNQKLAEAKLVWGAASLPVDFRTSEEKFQDDLKKLPAAAKVLQDSGVTRVGTWIRPSHATLTYRENFRLHAKRLKETAVILEQHGLRFGLEYVGTKLLWAGSRFPFIHTMKETKELIAVVGQNNVGFVLDSWHWTMANETIDDIKTLTNKDVVVCDLNDAPAGIKQDDQVDNSRELPMATGVIDTKSFLQGLADINFDGPIRAEPFNKPLNALDNEAAAAKTAEAMKKAFATIGA